MTNGIYLEKKKIHMYVQVNHFAVHQLKLTLVKQLYFN